MGCPSFETAEVVSNPGPFDKPVRSASKYPEVVLPTNEQPRFGDYYVQLAEQKAELAELMISHAATYNSPDSDKFVLVDQKRGEKCCVRSSTGQQWYRGVMDTLEGGTARVTFMDFGTPETVVTEELLCIRLEFLQHASVAVHCGLAGLDNNAQGTPDENDVFLKKTQDKDQMVTLNPDNTGHTEAYAMDGSVNMTSLFPRRMTLIVIVEKLPGDGNSKMTDAEHQDDKLSTCQTNTSDLVSHVLSPPRFWFQPVRSEAELACLSEQMSYASLDQTENNWKQSVAALCVVRHTDGNV